MRITAVIAGAFLLAGTSVAADTQLLNLVMPDARVMAGVNVTTAKISPLGQFVLSRAGTNDKTLQELISLTGFDPRQDVTELMAASNGLPSTHSGLLLAKGSFDVSKITAAVAAKAGDKHTVETYAGATLISGGNDTGKFALGFIGSNISVAGDVASVKAALDRANGVNSIDPALATKVNQLSSTQDAWTVSLQSLGALLPATGPAEGPGAQTLQLVKNIQSSSGGVKFGSMIQVTGQAITDTPQNATALADVIRMISGLIQMSSAGQNSQASAAAQLLQNLNITTEGATVNISASIPETQVEALMKMASARVTPKKPM